MKISYLGPEGSYSWIVANKLANKVDSPKLIPYTDIKSILKDVVHDDQILAILPVENKIIGLENDVLEQLDKYVSKLEIYDEITIPVVPCLLSQSSNLSHCSKIYSENHLKDQCSNFLDDLSLMKFISSTSSSEAAMKTAFDPKSCAIGSFEAAEIYDLKVLAINIGNEKDNWTKFIVIRKRSDNKLSKEKLNIQEASFNNINNGELLKIQINDMDTDIMEFISKRLELIEKLNEFNIHNNLPRISLKEDEEYLDKKIEEGKKFSLDSELIQDIWKRLIIFGKNN